MKNHIRKIVLLSIVLLAGLLAVQGMGWLTKPMATDEQQFPQKVNLAMRQAADRLLDLAGDTTSTIPPVERVATTGEYLLRLENNFSYDSLPVFLKAAFDQFGIQADETPVHRAVHRIAVDVRNPADAHRYAASACAGAGGGPSNTRTTL